MPAVPAAVTLKNVQAKSKQTTSAYSITLRHGSRLHCARRCYSLRDDTVVVAGRARGAALRVRAALSASLVQADKGPL